MLVGEDRRNINLIYAALLFLFIFSTIFYSCLSSDNKNFVEEKPVKKIELQVKKEINTDISGNIQHVNEYDPHISGM